MKKIIWLINTRLRYYLTSKTKFGIHSPFMYDFVVNVLEDRTEYEVYKKIENRRKELLRDKRLIQKTDLGAREKKTEQAIKIGEIIKKESVSPKNGRLLYRIARKFNALNILELGTSAGISTAYLASAVPAGKVITMEGCPELCAIARETFEALSLQNIEVINGNFDEELPRLLKTNPCFDMIFIDGNHKKSSVISYFEMLLPHVHHNTVWIFDDIHWSPDMEEAWDELCNSDKVQVTVDLFHFGIIFFKKELSKQRFVIRYS